MGEVHSCCIKKNVKSIQRNSVEIKGFEDFERTLSADKHFFAESAIIKKEDRYFTKQQEKYYKNKFSSQTILKAVKTKKKLKIKWKEGELIGHGSYGRVMLGFNLDTGELMAVKQIIFPQYNHSAEKLETIQSEINLLANLKHPNIVRYIGTTKEKEKLNIFLEYVGGGSLSSLIIKFGSLNESIARLYTRQIIEGLEYLHWNGVIHRDIKGANVLVDNNGVCKLSDFGSSKNMGNGSSALSEKYNSLKGTANWMAPEVIKQTGHGRHADIWSLGCTVIEMITGKPPWHQFGNPVYTMYHIAKKGTPPELPINISKSLQEFLLMCFKKQPTDRPNIYELTLSSFYKKDNENGTIKPDSIEISLSGNNNMNRKLMDADEIIEEEKANPQDISEKDILSEKDKSLELVKFN